MTPQTKEPQISSETSSRPLECEECGRGSHDGRGWRADIAFDPEDGEPAGVAV